jgi:lysophospholipase L1-like esterase
MKTKYRLSVLFTVGIAAIAVTMTYRSCSLAAPPVGSGPAGPAVDRAAFDGPWTDRKVLLLGLGDSVTAGFGVPYSQSYFGRLVQNPDDECDDMQGICLSRVLPNLKHRNLSVSGSTSLHHVDHIRDRLAAQPDDVFGLVVMTSGGNDLIHDYGRSPPRRNSESPSTWFRCERRFSATAFTAATVGGNTIAQKTHTTGTPSTSKTPTPAATTPSGGCS